MFILQTVNNKYRKEVGTLSSIRRKLTEDEKREHSAYRALVLEKMPKSKTFLRCVLAFLTGGAICCFGQLTGDIGQLLFSLDESGRGAFTSVVLIFAAALLTGIGVYDKIGRFAGAGSVIPITGFSNSVVAPAMEHRSEGIVMGVCAQLFSIAGPVLVFGITSSVAVGIIAWAIELLKG
jgi:stage V sporulation protein AC